jgi:uncharacterized membrane protein HdeD (DUF308 family)
MTRFRAASRSSADRQRERTTLCGERANSLSADPQQTNIWWLFLLQGMAGIVSGLMLITAPEVTTVTLVSFVGLYWLIMGVLALVRVFVDQSVPWLWSLLTGLIGIPGGIFFSRHPLLAGLTVPTVVVFVGAQGLIMGAIEIVSGFLGGGIKSFLPGVIYLLAALFLLSSPIAPVLQTPLVFSVLLLVQGVLLTILAIRART